MLFLMFFYVLAAVMCFQGMHLLGEVSTPLGTLPEEVGQAPAPSRTWGAYLMTYSALMVGTALSSMVWVWLEPTLRPLLYVGFLNLGLFAAWVVFKGRTVEFIGKPSTDYHDHNHGHATHH